MTGSFADRSRSVVAVVVTAAVVVVLVMVGVIWYVATDHDETKFSATFVGAVGLYPGSDVRMLGVKVGEVDEVTPQGTTVVVKAHLSPGFAAQPGTEAVIFSPSLVSDRYVQLTKTWTSGPKLADGAAIPIERTATPVELDQIYSSVLSLTDALGPNGANANGALSDLLNTGAANLDDNGKALNQALTQFSAASGTLASTKDNLFATVDNLSQFTTMLQANDAKVADLNTRLAAVSQVLSDDRQTFSAALQQLSSALATVQGFIADNRRTLTQDVDKLATITQTLVDERDSLSQALSAAPLLVGNLLNTYDPVRNVLVGRGDVNELSLWSAVSSVGNAAPNAASSTPLPQTSVVTTGAADGQGPPLLLPSAGSFLVTRLHRRPLRRRLALGATAALASLSLTACSFSGLYDVPLPGGADLGDHPFEITAEFTDVLDLVPQSSVKVGNVPVGRVTDIELGPGGRTALVTLQVNGDVDLPANAVAAILQTSLLGEKYIDLARPSNDVATGELRGGARISVDNTSEGVQVEQVFGALSLLLNGGGLEQIQNITSELNKATDGRAADYRSLLDNLDSTVTQLDQRKVSITRALDSVNLLATNLRLDSTQIANVLDNIAPGLQVLADQRTQFVDMLDSLNRLSAVTVSTLDASKDDIVADLDRLAPILAQLAAAGSALPDSLQVLLTYPFPDAVLKAIKGDYLNGFIVINLNTTQQDVDATNGAATNATTGGVPSSGLPTTPSATVLGTTPVDPPPSLLPPTTSASPGLPSSTVVTVPSTSPSASGSATGTPSGTASGSGTPSGTGSGSGTPSASTSGGGS